MIKIKIKTLPTGGTACFGGWRWLRCCAMRLLDRYLLRELLIPLGYCLSGFLIFWIAFDLFSQLDDFQRYKLKGLEVAEFYLVKTPELLVTVMPIALLLALLYALTNHARHQELTAIRAAGVSLWRTSLPYLAVGLFFSLVLFGLNETIVPDSASLTEEILHRHQPVSTNDPSRFVQRNLEFRNTRDNRFWSIQAYNVETYRMVKPLVVWVLPDGSQREIVAERGERVNGVWTFYGVQQLISASADALPQPRFTNELAFPEFSETPEQIKSEIKYRSLTSRQLANKVQLSLPEILNYLRLHPQLSPADSASLHTQLHARLAAPWTCLVVVLIALPFGAPSGRRNVFVGVASSIFIGFTYFVLLRLGMALGIGNHLPPWLAAWLPNLLFGGAGLWLTQRVR